MAIPSFSAFHDEGINLEGLLEILSPENNLVLADDMMVSDGNGIILRVSETYEKNFGFAHDSIVGKSAFDLEADGTFTPTNAMISVCTALVAAVLGSVSCRYSGSASRVYRTP